MNVYAQSSISAPTPRLLRDEPHPPVFTGTPAEVAAYLSPRLVTRTHTMALVSAELRVLNRDAVPNASLRFELADRTSVTIRPRA
jgi:hypothetical protein